MPLLGRITLKIFIRLSSDYPITPPFLHCDSPVVWSDASSPIFHLITFPIVQIFHPNISPCGGIGWDLLKQWKPNETGLKFVFELLTNTLEVNERNKISQKKKIRRVDEKKKKKVRRYEAGGRMRSKRKERSCKKKKLLKNFQKFNKSSLFFL